MRDATNRFTKSDLLCIRTPYIPATPPTALALIEFETAFVCKFLNPVATNTEGIDGMVNFHQSSLDSHVAVALSWSQTDSK